MKIDQILFFFLSFSVNSCDTSKENSDIKIIKQIFENYKQSTLKEDYDALFDFIYPEVFKESSKKEEVNVMKNGMHNEKYDLVIKDIFTDSLYNVEKYGSNKYSLIVARFKATMYLKSPRNDSMSLVEQFNQTCTFAKNELGQQNVDCNPKEHSIGILQTEINYFIFDEKYKKWFMLSNNNPEDIEKFIPKEIRKRFGVN